MFNRMVCMNGGIPDERLIDHKYPEKVRILEHTVLRKELSISHLERRTAGFFCYDDQGGDEMDENNVPKVLRHKIILMAIPNLLKKCARLIHHWYGNAGMVVLKFLNSYGNMQIAVWEKIK